MTGIGNAAAPTVAAPAWSSVRRLKPADLWLEFSLVMAPSLTVFDNMTDIK
jgi:hypothetical protein